MAKVLTLLYHRVNAAKDDIFGLTVSPEKFEYQIKYLKDNYPVISFDSDWETCKEDCVVITFDDGYMDNYKYALPILQKYNIPATIFVSSGYIDSDEEYWWDEIARLLTCGHNYPTEFILKDTLYNYKWHTGTESERIDLIKSLHWLLKLDSEIERANYWISQLRKWSGVDQNGRIENLPMTLTQLKEIDKSDLITIGAHTVNHRSLGCQNYMEQEYEIGNSITTLQKQLDHSINVFSYPFGSNVHFNGNTLEICKKNGIIRAATTNKGVWEYGIHPYMIPRVEVKDLDVYEFKRIINQYLEG